MTQPFSGQVAHSRVVGWGLRFFPWLGAALFVALGWRWISGAVPLNAESPWLQIWLQLLLAGLTGLLLLLFTRSWPAQLRTTLLVIGVGLFFFLALALRLKNTPFTVGGISGDTRFYTTYVTKMAAYGGYGDMFYQGLPAYYPPLYFFAVGRAAAWLDLEPFRVMKFGLFTVVLLMPVVGAWLWRRLVDSHLAAVAALALLIYPDWFKPNEWLALVTLIPWWLYWVDNLTGYTPPTRAARWRWWLAGGLIGSLIFQLYFFWFFVGGVTLLVRIGWWLGRRHDVALRRQLVNSLLMLGVTALLSSIFWGPYLASMVTTGSWQPLQNRFFGESKTPLPLPFLEVTWHGVVYAAGLLYLCLAASRDRLACGLLWLVGGFYAWVVIGYGALLVEMPLLTFRSYPFIDYLLGLAALLALLRLWSGGVGVDAWWPAILPRRTFATALLLFVSLLFANGVVNGLLTQENVQDAVDAIYPADELAAFDTLTGGAYQGRVGLVTDGYRDVLFFRPLFTFMAWSAHFSHPAGDFHARARFLTKLAQSHDPTLFAAALRYNRYSPVAYLFLRREGEYWHFNYVDDNFPDRTLDRELYFPQQLLATPFFTTSVVADYPLIKPVAALDPLADVAQTAGETDLTKVARAYALQARFGEDLALPALAAIHDVQATVLQGADLTQLPIELLLDLYQAQAAPTTADPLAAKVTAAVAQRLGLSQPLLLQDQAGQARLRLLGYAFQPVGATHPQLDLYFEVLAPLPENYTIWLHAYQGERRLTFDHTPVLATSAWQPGLIYRDRYQLVLPPGQHRVEMGLWQSESGARLTQADGTWATVLGLYTAAE